MLENLCMSGIKDYGTKLRQLRSKSLNNSNTCIVRKRNHFIFIMKRESDSFKSKCQFVAKPGWKFYLYLYYNSALSTDKELNI